jgi:phosphohistidine phosphatase
VVPIEASALVELYLARHGEPTSEAENPQRPLSARGRAEVRRVGAAAACLGLRPIEIRHSGKCRAAQTADILAEALGLREAVVAVSGLAPNDDVWPVAAALAATSQSVMLVGHLPFLSRLASLLLVGDPDRPLVRFPMGGIVCLAAEPPAAGASAIWNMAWALTPAMASSAIPEAWQ